MLRKPLNDVTNQPARPVGRALQAAGLEHLPAASGISTSRPNSISRNSQLRRRRAKPGLQFFITLNPVNYYDEIRSDFLHSFENLVTYCISIERSKENLSARHLHSYIEFEGKVYLENLRVFLVSLFPDSKLDLQPCRSKKTVLKYVSKEDTDLLTNVSIDKLHFNYRIYNWAKNNPVFSYLHPFVVEHRFNHTFLKNYHSDFYSIEKRPFPGYKPFLYTYPNWAGAVISWFNNFIKLDGYKNRQMFIYGDNNMGKTSLVKDHIIGSKFENFIFRPGVGKFAYQDFRQNYHKFVIFDEFELIDHDVPLLKQFLEGREMVIPVKCGHDRKISLKNIPIFLMSNSPPPTDPAILIRLTVIYADKTYYTDQKELYPETKVQIQTTDIQQCEEITLDSD